jgi:predicted dehydrogenase
MSKSVRIVLFGNSYAEAVQLPALAHIGGNEVIGIAGYDGEKAAATAQRWGIKRATSDWLELLELDPDLVIVATPVDLHYEMVRGALGTSAAVLCEKPFTIEVPQAEELTELAQGRLALINYQLRWNPYRRKMRSLCQTDFVGKVLHVRADLLLDTPGFAERPYSWWSQAPRGGGVLGAIGTHVIDNVQWMFGPIEAVSARLETFVKRREDAQGVEHEVTSDDFAQLSLRLESGAHVNFTVSLSLHGVARWLLEVAGSAGSLRLDREQHLVGGTHGCEMLPIESEVTWLPPEHYGIQGRGPFAALQTPFLAAVVEAVAGGQTRLEEAATFADGLTNVRILDAARQSSLTGGGWVSCL